MLNDGRISDETIGPSYPVDKGDSTMDGDLSDLSYLDGSLNTLAADDYYGEFVDDISGQPLLKSGVVAARQSEMFEFGSHHVYEKRPITECVEVTGRQPIGCRWIDINKGDEVNPEYRSRLVAQEVNLDNKDSIFAATPPLEAKKALFSLAVTEGIGWGQGWQYKLDFIDVKRAYFYAPAKRDVYVKLPPEDFEEGMCGKLVKSMYGTRDAALNWEIGLRR